ncbi:MAG: 5-formyltetrahydrofolate cyclo-ligase [Ruminococcus sp.]|nr:5-formyltetrahydrofolate cyclo-ligase [Ruminococcus sp.]
MSKMQAEKATLRKHCIEMRDKMTPSYKRSLDVEIASRFLCSIEYMKADTLLTYVAKSSEVETRDIINAALTLKKRVAVPKCEGEGVMHFYLINSTDDLSTGYMGIMEPDTDKCQKLECFDGAVCIVPGYTFDPRGNRIGYGGGYYDRFLSDKKIKTVGLCYQSFIKWDIPRENHDIPVDILVTDRFIRHTSEK